MRAIVQDRYGDADVLELRDVPEPRPAKGEVLVRVRAAGIDRGTWHQMTGLPLLARLAMGPRRPRQPTPGLDLAGVVEAAGEGVDGFAIGDEVLGIGRGSLAELARARVDKLVRKPEGLSFEAAAVVAISGLTALQGVRKVGRVRAGQTVLVIGASGGVGTYAVQIAKADGAEVTAVCGTAKTDLVRELGADHVIDYTKDELTGQYDLILDIAGNRPIATLRKLLTDRGTLVIVGGEGGGRWLGGLQRGFGAVLLSPFVRQRLTMFVSSENAPDIQTLTDLIDEGKVKPSVGQAFPLGEAPQAIQHLESGQARGKVVVTI